MTSSGPGAEHARQHIIENPTVTTADGNDQQGFIADEGCALVDCALVNFALEATNYQSFLAAMPGSDNVLIAWPKFKTSQNYDLPPTGGVYSQDVRLVMDDNSIAFGQCLDFNGANLDVTNASSLSNAAGRLHLAPLRWLESPTRRHARGRHASSERPARRADHVGGAHCLALVQCRRRYRRRRGRCGAT